jgi:signal transduction histidine kinase
MDAWPAAERLLVARELHDVVSHTIVAIGLQAATALHLLGDTPERAAESLHAIREASLEGLQELRGLLARLRDPEMQVVPDEVPFTARVTRLAEQTTAAGVPTHLEVSGVAWPLPHSTSRELYRVVQESLTNVLRHACATCAVVSITYGDDLVVEIRDDGVGGCVGASPGSGLGIVGMRERLESVGGSIEVGTLDGGGFHVRARIPQG